MFLLWEWSTWAESGLQLVALQLRDPQDGAWLGTAVLQRPGSPGWMSLLLVMTTTIGYVLYIYTHMYIYMYIYIVNTCRIIQYIYIYITSRSSSIEGIISTSFICDDPFYCGNDIDESWAWLRWWYLSNWHMSIDHYHTSFILVSY